MHRLLSGTCLLLCVTCSVRGQQGEPHIGYLYPAGGRTGAVFDVVVGGQFLNGITNIYLSGAGVTGKIMELTRPLTPKELNELRQEARELQDRKAMANRAARQRAQKVEPQNSTNTAWTAEDEKRLAMIRRKLNPPGNRQPSPAIAEKVTVELSIAADAAPGARELRLETASGLSNPMVFHVGRLPEFTEEADAPDSRARYGRLSGTQDMVSSSENEMNITQPAMVNGQIMPGGVDRYRFAARKGERLVLAVQARELIPYLADAVPGWFQATLALYDSAGKELAYRDDFQFSPDPVLYYEIPADGEYVAQIRDSIYRGREDFVYRLAIGEFPLITGVFPLGGPTGSEIKVELFGWNLPTNSFSVNLKESLAGMLALSWPEIEQVTHSVTFAADTLPETLEKEPNESNSPGQQVDLPVVVNGRIGRPGDIDIFQFEGKAGSVIVAEVTARRLNSPLDSMLKLTDSSGRQLTSNDDFDDKAAGLSTHHADSYLRCTLPADGRYFIHLSDTQGKGAAEYAYRLRVSAPRPDFALRVAPASVTARVGVSVPLTVYAVRKDGFTNEILLDLKAAPRGFSMEGGRIPPGEDQVRITLTPPSRPLPIPATISLVGRGLVEGREVVRPATPATDMMQAFAYRHLVPAQELKVSVIGRGISRAPVQIRPVETLAIPAGGTAIVQVAAPRGIAADRFEFKLSEPPEGIVIGSVSTNATGAQILFRSDRAKAKLGLQGNLIISVLTARASRTAGRPPPRAFSVGTLPAIPFEIVP